MGIFRLNFWLEKLFIFFFFLHQLYLRFIFTTNPSLWLLATPLYSNILTPITPQTYGTEEVYNCAVLPGRNRGWAFTPILGILHNRYSIIFPHYPRATAGRGAEHGLSLRGDHRGQLRTGNTVKVNLVENRALYPNVRLRRASC